MARNSWNLFVASVLWRTRTKEKTLIVGSIFQMMIQTHDDVPAWKLRKYQMILSDQCNALLLANTTGWNNAHPIQLKLRPFDFDRSDKFEKTKKIGNILTTMKNASIFISQTNHRHEHLPFCVLHLSFLARDDSRWDEKHSDISLKTTTTKKKSTIFTTAFQVNITLRFLHSYYIDFIVE